MTRPPARFLDRSTPPVLATLVLMAGLSALTMNIFLPSLPGMAAWFGVPYGLMQQSVALYLALSAALQIVIGPLSDRFGRRKVIAGALVLFPDRHRSERWSHPTRRSSWPAGWRRR
jgi:DHA1 family bicyclomycin/chloramphenicol resistance-like MFS transporter